MRKINYGILMAFSLFSCEDVVDVELGSTEPRLVVNGVLRADFNQEYVPVEIKVSETTDFFENNVPAELDTNAIIYYGRSDPNGQEDLEDLASSSLTEQDAGSGVYVPDPSVEEDQRIRTSDIFPNMVFILVMEHRGHRYMARTPFSFTVPIDNLEQGDETLFDEDDVEIKITINDIADIDNYYVFDFGEGEFLALDDQFINGQEFEFSYFPERTLEPGEQLEVAILGADQRFFNYMDLIVEQTENNGGIFEAPPATVRGNVFDVTGHDNGPDTSPMGYFAVVQEFKQRIIIE